MAYRSSDEIIKRMIFRKLYNRMSDKGRLAVFISTVAACVVGLVVLTVGCIMMKNSNDLRVPMMIAVIGFVLAGLGIFFGSFVSDAANYRSRSGVYGDAFAERSIDPSTAEGIAMAKDMNKQKDLDRKMGIISTVVPVSTVVLAVLIIALVFIL